MKKDYSILFYFCLFTIWWLCHGCVERTEIPFPFTPEAACGIVVTLSSQADIDQFDQTEIKGDLIISGDDITDLHGLNELIFICGSLEIIFCPNLHSIAGLNNELSVGGHFFVTGNTRLVDFRGFPTNFSLDGRFKIQSNNALINLNGISSELALQKLELLDNPNLENLAGVPDHVDIFILEDSPKIKNLEGLSPGFGCSEFNVHQCEALKNLQGFSINIQSLMVLRLINNANLEEIDNLSNLRFVRKELNIEGNPQLMGCCSLRSLIDSFGITPFKTNIRNNHPDCNPSVILGNALC